MTTIKNYKSKKVSNPYTRYFDVKQFSLNTNKSSKVAEFTRETKPNQQQLTRAKDQNIRTSALYMRPEIKWKAVTDVFINDAKGSPYMLVSEDDTLVNTAGTNKRRGKTTCYNVLHEPRLRLDPTDIEPLIRGIRISICVEHTRFPLVGKVSKGLGLTHVPEHRLWNVQWCDNTPHLDLLKSMKRFQQINHFPGMSEICRKDLLSRNLNRMLKLYPGDYRIFPKTWLLPTDTYDVAIYSNKHNRTFILKPYSSGQGRGIWLTNNLRTVGRQEKLICQTYIERPLLIDGFKFDLRVYTLVTSVDPLRIFVYNEGLARFATQKYKAPALGNSNNMFMHLTNYCVNRRSSNYDSGSGNDNGSKRKLSAFNNWLVKHSYSVEEFWATVDDAIIKTIISAWPVLKHNYHLCFPKHDKIQACFQLLGFDILVDWKLKPYILEVNHTPSLSGGERVDNEVKRPLIRDTLNLISTPLVDKEEIIREDRALLRERLIKQTHRRRLVTPNKEQTPIQRAAGGAELNQACPLSALAQQIAWEESHLGNYRRIMPPTDTNRVNYYFKFYNQYKEVSMFKEINASKSQNRINRENLRQQELQEQLEAEQNQMQRLGEQKEKLQQMFFQSSKKNFTALLEQKRAEALDRAKNMYPQKLDQVAVTKDADTMEMADKLHLENMQQEGESAKEHGNPGKLKHFAPVEPLTGLSPGRTKCNLIPVKARRRIQRRQMLNRARCARRLERESRMDAEFLIKHGLRARLMAGSCKLTDSTLKTESQNQSQQQLIEPKISKVNANAQAKAKLRPVKKIKAKLVNQKQPAGKKSYQQQEQQSKHWLPEPIFEADNEEQVKWRRQRTAAINGGQFKETLFHEMYERGDLTKNDIKLFPNILYRILRNEFTKDKQEGYSKETWIN